MPTMRQTGINPQTEQKLSGTKRPSSSNNSSSECGLFIPIRTPSALLARDPHHLSSSLEVSLESIQNLRSTIAECVVLDPYIGHGGRAVEIREGVTKFCCCCVASSSSSPPVDDDESNDDHRPQAITVGAVTALDLYAQTLLMKRNYSSNNKNTPNHLEYISTGSVALDQLLLPSNEYHTFDEGYWNNLSAPFHIPNFDCYNNDAIPTPHNNTTSSSSSANGGIPFGQITEISGKTSSGKTQLALTITAHALIVNNLQVKYLIAGGGGGSSRMAISRRLLSVCMAVAKSHLLMTMQGETNDESTINIDKEAKSLALKCMERVTIATVQDAYVLLGSLVQIENEELSYRSTNNNDESASAAASSSLLKNCMDNHHKGTLVIIDSISGCLGHHIYSDLTVGASLSNQVSLTLRRMARSYDGHFDSSSSSSSVVMDHHHHHSVDRLWQQQQQQHPPRRFAVVVINGTVGKGANDSSSSTSEVGGNGITSYSSFSSSHKPAMGRYWQGGDMGLWLEEEDDDDGNVLGDGNSNSHAISSLFYDGNVPGLSRSSEKVVTATLQWHYGKSLGGVDGSSLRGGQGDGRQARFVIQAGGVVDV
jgi:hypothetical protein